MKKILLSLVVSGSLFAVFSDVIETQSVKNQVQKMNEIKKRAYAHEQSKRIEQHSREMQIGATKEMQKHQSMNQHQVGDHLNRVSSFNMEGESEKRHP